MAAANDAYDVLLLESKASPACKYLYLMLRLFKARFANGGDISPELESQYADELDDLFLEMTEGDRKRIERTFGCSHS